MCLSALIPRFGGNPDELVCNDLPLEQAGFELLVPSSKRTAVRRARPFLF